MNVHDNLKAMSVEEIRDSYVSNTINAAVGMTHISGDFNLGNVIRSANFFGFKEAYYVGGKRSYDRRSTVGTHNYIPVQFMKTEEEFLNKIRGEYNLICVENNLIKEDHIRKSFNIFEILGYGTLPPLFLFGEEQMGISENLLDNAISIITIPAFGTVRSMNVGSCAAIVMAMYRNHLLK